ncbi:hypothetical protein LSH36_618g01067, partial [Paralvinella palmiformis]
VQPEHFIFSTFGVLHVFPRQPSENLSLAAWQREAVIFSTIIKIPFFKYYLLRRMFVKWRANVHFKEYSTIRHQMSEGLLQAIPSFGAALLHISKLCQELLNLTFLPTDTVSKDSLTLQKAKRRQRALNLTKARQETMQVEL